MNNIKENRTLDYYLGLDYPLTIYHAKEGGYVAEFEDLPGCITEGETLEEVSQKIEEARRAWIEVAYEDGMEIPLPRTEREYSGKFVVRMPKHLHRRLAEQAEREGVSLNQYVETILSSGAAIEDSRIKKLIDILKQSLSPPLTIRGSYYALNVAPAWTGFEAEEEPVTLNIVTLKERKEQVAA